jgi:hypothetical protein
MKIFTIALIFLSLLSCTRTQEVPAKQKATNGDAVEVQYKKEMEEIKKSLKSDIKIKLKRDGKGAYTWEIGGKDPLEILKANETLRKRLADSHESTASPPVRGGKSSE